MELHYLMFKYYVLCVCVCVCVCVGARARVLKNISFIYYFRVVYC